MGAAGDILLALLALFLPPLPVLLRRGCGADFLINLLLSFLGWIPGVIHAFYIIFATPRREIIIEEKHRPRSRHSHRSHRSHSRSPHHTPHGSHHSLGHPQPMYPIPPPQGQPYLAPPSYSHHQGPHIAPAPGPYGGTAYGQKPIY